MDCHFVSVEKSNVEHGGKISRKAKKNYLLSDEALAQ